MAPRFPTTDTLITARCFRLSLQRFGTTQALREAILKGTGVTEGALDAGIQVLTLDQHLKQQDNLSRLFGRAWAVSAPELWGHPTYGSLGLATQSAGNLRQALSVIVTQGAAATPLSGYELKIVGVDALLACLRRFDVTQAQWREAVEIAFIGLGSLLRFYLMRRPSEARFLFSGNAPVHSDQLKAVLGGDVVFNADVDGVAFPGAWLQQKSPLHDATAFRLATWQLETENAALSPSEPIRMRVEHLLRARPNGRSTLKDVASALGLSPRTLIRRLGEARTSFRALLEAEQMRRAAELARLQNLKSAEVSEHLGYSDPGSFARARRRWARRLEAGG
jgi:AraC-like DNA-binding protein